MALFDLSNGAETRADRDKAWREWLERREAAANDKREFNEPPTDRRMNREEMQVLA